MQSASLADLFELSMHVPEPAQGGEGLGGTGGGDRGIAAAPLSGYAAGQRLCPTLRHAARGLQPETSSGSSVQGGKGVLHYSADACAECHADSPPPPPRPPFPRSDILPSTHTLSPTPQSIPSPPATTNPLPAQVLLPLARDPALPMTPRDLAVALTAILLLAAAASASRRVGGGVRRRWYRPCRGGGARRPAVLQPCCSTGPASRLACCLVAPR